MLDEMAGNVLAVLMYIGAFRDLLRGCGGKGGACVQPHCSASIDQSRVSKQFGDAVSEEFFFFFFFSSRKQKEISISEKFRGSFGFLCSDNRETLYKYYFLHAEGVNFRYETGRHQVR